jgi:hypothetical protein
MQNEDSIRKEEQIICCNYQSVVTVVEEVQIVINDCHAICVYEILSNKTFKVLTINTKSQHYTR